MDTTKLKPKAKAYLIKPHGPSDQTTDGYLLSNESNTAGAPTKGTIIKVGDQCRYAPGQDIYFTRYSLNELKWKDAEGQDQSLYIVEEEEILLSVEI